MRISDAVRKRFNVVQEIGDEYLIHCPEHDDRRPSASVNVKKGLWTCYACGRGGKILDYLDGVRITTEPETQDLLEDLEDDLAMLDQMTIHDLPEAWLDQFDIEDDGRGRGYWRGRGFKPSTIQRFRLGYDHEWDTPTYPVRAPDGKVLGVIRRRLHDGQTDPDGNPLPKYKYPRHVDVSECLFGYERLRDHPTKHLVVTEGALDAMAFWEVGIPAVGQYGIRLREPQIRLLERLGLVSLTLAYDKDKEGRDSVHRTLYGYRDDKGRWHPPLPLDFVIVRVARWNGAYKDPLDLPWDIRRFVVESASVWGGD